MNKLFKRREDPVETLFPAGVKNACFHFRARVYIIIHPAFPIWLASGDAIAAERDLQVIPIDLPQDAPRWALST